MRRFERSLSDWNSIVVVKKTLRYSNVFFYNPLYRNSVIGNIIMESGVTLKRQVHPGFGFCTSINFGLAGNDPFCCDSV